jgi:hypothetical protein
MIDSDRKSGRIMERQEGRGLSKINDDVKKS